MTLVVGQCIHGLGLGGAQKIIASIVRGRSEGFEHVVYSCEDGVLMDEVERAGATVRIVPRHVPKWDHGWMRRTAAAFERDGVDVVHGHLFGDTLHGYFAARRAGDRPFLMTLHNDYRSFSRLQRWGYSYLLKHADMSVGCSDFVRRSFAEHSALNGRLVAVPNGVEPPIEPRRSRRELLEELGAPDGRQVVMAFGRLSEQKGYSHLLEALASLEERPHLVLVGEGELEGELRRQADALGIGELVTFAGFRSDVGDLMYAADIVVFPSLWEGLPVALIEAMARARCLIVTDLPGMVEAVGPERGAIVVPPGDSGALAEALHTVTTSPELRMQLSRGAAERWEESYTADAMVRAYEALYRRLASDEAEVQG